MSTSPLVLAAQVNRLFSQSGALSTQEAHQIALAIAQLNCDDFKILSDHPFSIYLPNSGFGSYNVWSGETKLTPQRQRDVSSRIWQIPTIQIVGTDPNDDTGVANENQTNVRTCLDIIAQSLISHPCREAYNPHQNP